MGEEHPLVQMIVDMINSHKFEPHFTSTCTWWETPSLVILVDIHGAVYCGPHEHSSGVHMENHAFLYL